MRTRLLALLVVALQLFLASCDRAPARPEAAPAPKPHTSHRGYYVEFPPEARRPSIDSTGGAVLTVTSNLPDGTIAHVISDLPNYGGPYLWPIRRFVAGTLKLRQPNYCVAGPNKDFIEHGFDIQVVVVADMSLIRTNRGGPCKSLTNCGVGPLQPRSVQRILGSNFERLTGDSVTPFLGTRAIVASAHYAWPGDECPFGLIDFDSGAPRTCEPASKGLNHDEGGVDIEEVAQSVTMLLGHNRVCDLYSFTSGRFRKAVPWSEFRNRVKRWPTLRESKSMGGVIFGKGPSDVGVLESPTFLEVRYVLYGKKVARARFVAQPLPSGYTKWQIEALELYDRPRR